MTSTFTYDYENRAHWAPAAISGRATASFVYDADGNRVKSTVGGVTTVYIAGVFEFIENGATDKITKYYEGNAMRRSGYGVDDGVFYLLQDHLKSSSVIVDQAGTTVATNYYYPYGGNRGGTAFSNLATKRFTGQYHESSLPGGEGLSYYNVRWYDAQLGRFLSADTLVPGSNNPQAFNRYSYVFNNPLKYNDPSGHCPWCIGGALIGGAVTGATYMLTTDYSNWRGSEIATVIGAGALAGGLIGSGIGLAAGTTQMVAAMSMASSAAVASGSGAIATAEAYMFTNLATGQQFDTSDFAVSTGTAAVEGAVNSLVPGSGRASGETTTGISTAFGAADYLGRNYANGTSEDVTASGIIRAGALWGLGSATGDYLSGGFSQANPLRLRNPVISKDWTPTLWLDPKLNSKLIWEDIKKMSSDAWRPILINTSILFGWAITDRETGQ